MHIRELPLKRTRFELGKVIPGVSYLRTMPDDVVNRRVFSGIYRFPRPFSPMFCHSRIQSHFATVPSISLSLTVQTVHRPHSLVTKSSLLFFRRLLTPDAHGRTRLKTLDSQPSRSRRFPAPRVEPREGEGNSQNILETITRDVQSSKDGSGHHGATFIVNTCIGKVARYKKSQPSWELKRPLAWTCDQYKRGRGGVGARLLTSHHGEPGSMWESCQKMPLVSGFFFGDLPFPPPLNSGAAPYSPRLTLTGSQDLDLSSLHPNGVKRFGDGAAKDEIVLETGAPRETATRQRKHPQCFHTCEDSGAFVYLYANLQLHVSRNQQGAGRGKSGLRSFSLLVTLPLWEESAYTRLDKGAPGYTCSAAVETSAECVDVSGPAGVVVALASRCKGRCSGPHVVSIQVGCAEPRRRPRGVRRRLLRRCGSRRRWARSWRSARGTSWARAASAGRRCLARTRTSRAAAGCSSAAAVAAAACRASCRPTMMTTERTRRCGCAPPAPATGRRGSPPPPAPRCRRCHCRCCCRCGCCCCRRCSCAAPDAGYCSSNCDIRLQAREKATCITLLSRYKLTYRISLYILSITPWTTIRQSEEKKNRTDSHVSSSKAKPPTHWSSSQRTTDSDVKEGWVGRELKKGTRQRIMAACAVSKVADTHYYSLPTRLGSSSPDEQLKLSESVDDERNACSACSASRVLLRPMRRLMARRRRAPRRRAGAAATPHPGAASSADEDEDEEDVSDIAT
ncbi:hypothetical protein PR048_010433 [Dryococelus australis]|uniref:Uncharacterized protein n=1 Tax=Dryococelus australis TaxID=614101 RepID=A0ABQ9I2P3_9NEOP|nr:hypothetical protein PR048_010433 [Dryococelus australis]